MGRQKKKTGYELFRHQLVTFIIMLCIFALSAGWYLTAPTTAKCALMLALGILGPLFPSDTRPEMTNRDSEFLYWFIFVTQWALSCSDFLLSNLIATGCAAVIGLILYRTRFKLQRWLHDHPSDRFVFSKASWMMLFWCGTVLVFGGTVGLISAALPAFFVSYS